MATRDNYYALLEKLKRARTERARSLLSQRDDNREKAKEAVKLLEEGVEQDDAEAMWILGVCKAFGLGTKQNVDQAEELYRKSSDKGNEVGLFLTRNMTYFERGSTSLGMWSSFKNLHRMVL